jgi:transcriptional regulator with XRE-family HTH domain
MKRIEQRLKAIRESYGKNQTEFANQFGLSLSKYQRIERGISVPDINFLLEVLDKYRKVEPLWLLMGKGEKEIKQEKRFDSYVVDKSDKDLLANVVTAVDNILAHGTNLAEQLGARKGKVIALLFELFLLKKREGNSRVDLDTVKTYLDLVIDPTKIGDH